MNKKHHMHTPEGVIEKIKELALKTGKHTTHQLRKVSPIGSIANALINIKIGSSA
jgi:hypothetical protein